MTQHAFHSPRFLTLLVTFLDIMEAGKVGISMNRLDPFNVPGSSVKILDNELEDLMRLASNAPQEEIAGNTKETVDLINKLLTTIEAEHNARLEADKANEKLSKIALLVAIISAVISCILQVIQTVLTLIQAGYLHF